MCVLFIQSDQLLLSAVMFTASVCVGVVARTLRLGQTFLFLLVDIRQGEVFYSILSKL